MAIGPEIRALCAHVASASTRPLPEEVRWRAKQHLLDSLAAVVFGSSMPAGRAALAWMDLTYRGVSGPASVLGTSRSGPPIVAAQVNGMAAHADEVDDSHAPSLSHPGCSVAPTIVAVAEEVGATGAEAIAAFVCGYDVGCRIGRATGSAFRDRSLGRWSSHSVIGTWCSAAAAGALYGFDEDEVRYLFSHTSQLTSGVTTWVRDRSHVQKAFVFGGMPATHAMLAASLARSGIDGVDDPFSGAPNYLEALSDVPDLAALTAGLGSTFEVMDATIKKYAVGSPAQAAVEATVALLAERVVKREEITAINVALPSESAVVVDNRMMPNVNVQYLVAATLVDGSFSMRMSNDVKRLSDPAVQGLMARIWLTPEEAFAHQRAARVTLTMAGGETISQTVRDVRGSPADPMSFDEVRTKAEDLLGSVLGAKRARAACDLVSRLEEVDDLRQLVALLVTPNAD
ncbi:MAG: MmgE/PrpD family protein [Acidimicrobiaceae bacterium]|nr:MmgE/PrpD family protein [Acidimicrobiaceae bacterium]